MAHSSSAPTQISINARAATRLRSGHVWVYQSDVVSKNSAASGALVHVVDPKGKMLGSAVYSSSSQIMLRLLTCDLISSEEELLQLTRKRLEEAVAYRSRIIHDANAYRLVFSEADRLPGLLIDR